MLRNLHLTALRAFEAAESHGKTGAAALNRSTRNTFMQAQRDGPKGRASGGGTRVSRMQSSSDG